MGYGWVHNYEMSLHIADHTNLTHTVIMQAPGGSRFPFYGRGASDSTYDKYPGVTASLERIEGTTLQDREYVVTTYNQFKATFDFEGRLIEREDPNGNVITFDYADFNGTERLYQASQGDRYLEFDYYVTDGRLHTVTDNTGRSVILGYQDNDLHTVTDPTGATITYEYEIGNNLLTEVIDGAGVISKHIFYDNQERAYRVEDGEGNILVDVDFDDGGTLLSPDDDLSATTAVTATSTVMTFTYGSRGTLEDVVFACNDGTPGCQSNIDVGYDYNFKQEGVQDANNNPTTLHWDEDGSNLEYKRDALNNETFMTYDSFNNLTQTVDARQNPTTYAYKYDDPNDPNWPYLPTFRSGLTDTLGNTTLYTPTIAGETGPIDGLLYEERDANGVVTRYGYNLYGQITQTVRAVGTPEAITTTYGYDAIGRLITTTQTSLLNSIKTVNYYDDNNRLEATIANWNNLPDWTDCTFDPGPREENICTLYRYDGAGRQISTTNALGQTNLTFYNEAGRRFLGVTNYDGSSYNANDPLETLCDFENPDAEYNHCSLSEFDQYGRVMTTTDSIGRQAVTIYDPMGRTAGSIANRLDATTLDDCTFPPLLPDQDLCTLYQYDNMGNTVIVTDPLGRMSYTEYDAINRVKGTIENWTPGMTLAECFSLPRERDHDICTQYQYDEVGNTVFVTNTLTQTTRTFFDPLNRVKATVENWQSGFDDPEDCHQAPDNHDDENVCTLYGYDQAGNQITTTNALNQTTLTVYDKANRPFLTVQNWDGTSITAANWQQTCEFPPAIADVNICAVTFYDTFGRRSASQDGMGNLTTYEYDELGRTITTTQTLTQLDNTTIPITHAVRYDALGNQLRVTDAEGHSTTYEYDSLNRLIQTTSAESITSTQAYNAAGWLIARTDGLGHATVNGYDLLGRRLTLTNPLDHLTTYTYDALGNQVRLVDAEGVTTTYAYDGLNRLVQVIENDIPNNSTPAVDRNVVTEYLYDALSNRVVITNARGFTSSYTTYDDLNRPIVVEDALGNKTFTEYNALDYRVVVTDANEAVTQYSYDGLNQVASVNYTADGEIVEYGYDAVGNRLVMTDGVGTTRYEYDNLYRLITATNPFTAVVGYRYDIVDNRTELIYPDGRTVTYTYDADNRLIQVEDWDEGITSYGYDGAGRLITTTLPNQVATVYTYDDANRLIELEHTDSDDGRLLARYEYEFDQIGNRTAVTETMRLPLVDGQAALPLGVVQGQEAPLTAEEAVTAIQPADAFAKEHLARLTQPESPVLQEVPPQPLPSQTTPLDAGQTLTTTEPLPLVEEETLPFDPAAVVEQARNQVETEADGTAYIERPTHEATFETTGELNFAPVITTTDLLTVTLDPATPLSITVELTGLAVGRRDLTINPIPGEQEVSENVVSLPRGSQLVEEFIARDGGIEQRWQLLTPPPGQGNLVLEVEASTALSLTIDTEGFVFHAPTEDEQVLPVARYSRALAIDATGAEQWAELSFIQLQPAPNGDYHYRLEMTIPADWLATAQYPLLIDPLLSNLVRLEQAAPVNNQQNVEVAYNPDDDQFLLVWQDYRNGNWDIYAQRVNGDGALLDENFIITNAAHEQSLPRVAYGNGVYLVAWKRHGSSSTTAFDVYGAIVSGAGSILHNNLQIAADTGSNDREQPSDIVYNSTSGQFLVLYRTMSGGFTNVWGRHVAPAGTMGPKTQITSQASNHEDTAVGAYHPGTNEYFIIWESTPGTNVRKLFGQRLTSSGSPVGSVIDVSSGSGDERQAGILYLADVDRYLVVWRDNRNNASSNYDIYSQRIAPNGTLDGSNLVVAQATVEESQPRLAVDATTGGALVVWQQNNGGSVGYDLYAHQLDNNGLLTGSSFVVEAVNANQYRPVLAQNAEGEYLFAWYDERHGNQDIFNRMRLADGSWGGAGMAHPAPGDQEKPQIAYNPDDDEYLVVWQDYRSSSNWDLYGQRVDGDGSLLGPNIAIDTTATKHQTAPQVAYGANEYLVAWQHYTDNNNTTYDVYGRVINRNGTFATNAFVIANALDSGSRPMKESPSDIAYNSASNQFLVVGKAEFSTNNWNIWGRRVLPTGVTTGLYLSIATSSASEIDAAAAYNLDNDQYLVVWDSTNDIGFSSVYGRRVNGNGTVITTDNIQISTSQAPVAAADIVYRADSDRYIVAWQQLGDIFSRGVLPNGSLAGSATVIANASQYETFPRLASDAQGLLAIWQRQNTGSGYDVYARPLDANGLPNGEAFIIQETAGNQQNTAVAYGDNLRYQLAWQDDRTGGWDLFTASLDRSFQVTHIQYEYDPLYRLVNADYSGDFNGEYSYAYDAVGNRTAYTTTITSTTVITYWYDAANQMLESEEVGGDTTTYEWDDAGRLITTTIGLNVSRVYTYSQDGDLTVALVDGLLTTFVYDGDGHRLQMSVAGEVTTYTLDYAAGFRVLVEEGGAFSDTKHYLYGLECIGELVDADNPETEEWRYYHQDGSHLVRQTTNIQATITLAWTYSPEGAVLLGEEGPVTQLDCGNDAIYDWSTGLIFKMGRYFDPNTGIWLTLSGIVIYQAGWIPNDKRRKLGKGKKRLILLFLLLMLALALAGCGGGSSTPGPCESSTPLPGTRPSNILVFGGSDAVNSHNPGPLPSTQIPHFAAAATDPAIQYPGSILDPETGLPIETGKQRQANMAKDYDGDLLIIGYSAGADAALIYADEYMRNHDKDSSGEWGIRGVALLGPTMEGTMTVGGSLETQWESIMDELLLGGTDIYLLDDDRLQGDWFNYTAPPSCTGILNKVRLRDQPHYDDEGRGTNDNATFAKNVLDWFGTPP